MFRRLPKWLRVIVLLAFGLLVAGGGGSLWLYYAARHVPEFYQQALAADPVVQEKASDECLQQATALASDVRREGRWQASFTAEQLNGWLAVDLVKNYPDLLPSEMQQPRVAIVPGEITVACRYDDGGMATVLSLSFDVYLSEPNVVAIRLHKARAGKMPIPLGQVLDEISKAAKNADLRLEWRQSGGDPVALVTLEQVSDKQSKFFGLDAIELRDNLLLVSGHTGEAKEEAAK